MTAREIRTILKELINKEHEQLKFIDASLKLLQPDINNARYLKLLAKASYHSERLIQLKEKLNNYRKRTLVKNALVNMNSKVKLVSTKIGAIIWVDARNYAELMGKSIGDVISMHNSQFVVAGIY